MLAKNLLETDLIPQEIVDSVQSMDAGVTSSLLIRYILVHLYDTLKQDDSIIEKVAIVFDKFNNLKKIAKEIRGESEADSDFSELDIINFLCPCASRWDILGKSLDVPKESLEDIKNSLPSVDSCKHALVKLIENWKRGEYKPPTRENLAKALESELLDEKNLASELKRFPRPVKLGKRPLQADNGSRDMNHAKRYKTDTDPSMRISQTRDSKVKYGNAFLLHVMLNPTSVDYQGDIAYQWSCGSDQISDGESYIGTDKPVLCIRKSCINMDKNKYSCVVHYGNDSPLTSKPILLNVNCILDQFSERIKSQYSAKPNIPEDSWPPRGTKVHIMLAIIKTSSRVNNFHTICGGVDDILKEKEDISYEDALNLNGGERLLIEGRPGSGKTTFVQKVIKDWAAGNLSFDSSKLVLLVPLRYFSSMPKNIELEDIFYLCFREKTEQVTSAIQFIMNTNGEGICFIFDGFDEYPALKRRHLVQDVLPQFSKSIVIIASRPIASKEIQFKVSKHVEIVGFKRDKIFDYINKYSFEEPIVLKKHGLETYLINHESILHMCYLPIHTVMVSFLYDQLQEKFNFRSGTEIYNESAKQLLLRKLRRDDDNVQLKSLDDIPESVKPKFLEICKIAWDMTVSQKQVLPANEIDSLGLVTIDKIMEIVGVRTYYSFHHLTFQEFFAAYHASKSPKDKQAKLIEEYGDEQHMRETWKFFCGIVGVQNDTVTLKTLLNHFSSDVLFKVQCVYESRQPQLFESETGKPLVFNNHFLTPYDFASVGYIISQLTHIKELVFRSCAMTEEGIDSFNLEVSGSPSFKAPITTLRFHRHRRISTGNSQKAIERFVESLKLLECLDLTESPCLSRTTSNLKRFLSHPNLKVIKLNEIKENVIALLNGLKTSPKLEADKVPSREVVKCMKRNGKKLTMIASSFLKGNELNLEDCDINDDDCEVIFGENSSKLSSINLSRNCIGDRGADSLVKHLHTKLCDLNLSHNTKFSVASIADGLKCCKNLKTLILWKTCLRNEGAKSLATSLKYLKSLQKLNLMSCQIDSSGAEAIGNELQHCSGLLELNLRDNQVGDQGAIAIADGLRGCKELTSLLRNNCCIGEIGEAAIRNCLQGSKAKYSLQNSPSLKVAPKLESPLAGMYSPIEIYL